jgi:hypothetical protein
MHPQMALGQILKSGDRWGLRRGGHVALLSYYDDMDKASPKTTQVQVVIGSSSED